MIWLCVRQNDLEIATGKVALVGPHRIVALCCRTPQRSRTKARYTTKENTPCGSDADPLSWPANALLHHQVGACGASADPPCALASHGAASRATAVDGMDLSELQAQLQSSKRSLRRWRAMCRVDGDEKLEQVQAVSVTLLNLTEP